MRTNFTNKSRELLSSRFLRFQKALVFVGGGAADVADPCQFAVVELAVFVAGIVPQKGSCSKFKGVLQNAKNLR